MTIGVIKEGPALLASTACSRCGYCDVSVKMEDDKARDFWVDSRMIPDSIPRLPLVFVHPLLSFPLSTLSLPLSIENNTGQKGPLYLENESAIVNFSDNAPLFHLEIIALSLVACPSLAYGHHELNSLVSSMAGIVHINKGPKL